MNYNNYISDTLSCINSEVSLLPLTRKRRRRKKKKKEKKEQE